MPAGSHPVIVSVIDPATRAAFAQVSGADADVKPGDSPDQATVTLKFAQVADVLRRLGPGRALAVTDGRRQVWVGPEAHVDGETVTVAVTRQKKAGR